MDGKSLDIRQENINKLKELMPEVFTEGDKIDFEKLKLTLGEDIDIANERYVLNWAGKSEAFKVLQTPTTATLAPAKDESVNFDTTENIFIEGENLEVLKILQKSYYGKIKMIYIDPPYNTGNDSFIYPDKFSETKAEYLKRIGEKDEEGFLLKEGLFRKNSKENGQYHSNWLNMMYPRLFLAKNLLKDDGVIFVSIDDNEMHNLKMVMNEIFGEDNFVAIIIRKTKSTTNDAKSGVNIQHEYCLVFSKSKENVSLIGDEKTYSNYTNPDDDPRGDWTTSDPTATDDGRKTKNVKVIENPYTGKKDTPGIGRRWRFNEDGYQKLLDEKRIVFKKKHKENERGFILKRYKNELQNENKLLDTLFIDNSFLNQAATKETYKIFEEKFIDYPKPVDFVKKLISSVSTEDDIVLDFFGGSGTTSQSVYELNKDDGYYRRFILVQLPEMIEEDSEAFKSGYKTIAALCKERIKRVIKKIEDEKKNKPELFTDKELDLGFKVFKLKYSNFKLWRGDIIENGEDLTKQIGVFENPVKEGSEEENILYELIIKSGYELTTKIEKKDDIYIIADGDLVIALSKFDESVIKTIIELKPKKCIALDKLFDGNDQLKTNTVLQMKDAGVEFRTI